ncbi:MAG: two component transcriptional regulator, winged helix family [Frankiales bacterium]|nr:two component transcriptional regulator, winged helix family [Frankiales bacterium]
MAQTAAHPLPAPHVLRAVTTEPGFTQRAREAGADLDGPMTAGPLRVDLDGYQVLRDEEPLDLTPRQVELMALFVGAPRKVWSRDQLHWVCWGDTTPSRRVDVQLCRLRAKTGIDLFRNVRDRGWALKAL